MRKDNVVVMNIQIFGTKKCKNTAKALRFFKERRIQVHMIDLSEKNISKGELRNITKTVNLGDLIDKESREYEKRNLHYLQHDVEKELLEHPLLFKMPIVRLGASASVGYMPEIWKEWIKNQK